MNCFQAVFFSFSLSEGERVCLSVILGGDYEDLMVFLCSPSLGSNHKEKKKKAIFSNIGDLFLCLYYFECWGNCVNIW